MRGGSLCDVVELCGGQLLETDGKVVMSCILQGLRAMHEGGYAHLDVKPANIGLAEEGDLNSVTLLDYGSAEPIGAAAASSTLRARARSCCDILQLLSHDNDCATMRQANKARA